MIVQFFCDDILISTFQGNREEIGAKLKDATEKLGLDIEDNFELQNRLTVLFQEAGNHDLAYQTGRFRFRLHMPEHNVNAA